MFRNLLEFKKINKHVFFPNFYLFIIVVVGASVVVVGASVVVVGASLVVVGASVVVVGAVVVGAVAVEEGTENEQISFKVHIMNLF